MLPSEPLTRCIVGLLAVFSCIVLGVFVIGNVWDHEQRPHRVRLVRRYPTERQIIGPNYHLHKLPDMPIDLKAGYEQRRRSVQYGRQRLVARSAILNRFRRNDQVSNVDERRYLPLLSAMDKHKFNLTCNTCALVANTGNMRQSSLGMEIDEANCIIRMDAAPTVGFERDVGRRTTVRVVSYTSLSDLAAEAQTLVALQPSASHLVFHGPEHVLDGSTNVKYLKYLANSRHDVNMFRTGSALEDEADFEFLKHTAKSRRDSSMEFSTDMYALLVAKDMCSSVTVYGMLPRDFCLENPGNRIAFKYYKDPNLTVCDMRDYHDNLGPGSQPLTAEKQVFDGWRTEAGIQFVNPSWE